MKHGSRFALAVALAMATGDSSLGPLAAAQETITKHYHYLPGPGAESLAARFAASHSVFRCRVVASTSMLVDNPNPWPPDLTRGDPRPNSPDVATKLVVAILEIFKGPSTLVNGATAEVWQDAGSASWNGYRIVMDSGFDEPFKAGEEYLFFLTPPADPMSVTPFDFFQIKNGAVWTPGLTPYQRQFSGAAADTLLSAIRALM